MLIRLLWKLSKKLTGFLERWHTRGFGAAWESLRERVWRTLPRNPTDWLNAYRPTPELLTRFRRVAGVTTAIPTITVLVPVFDTREGWLRQAVESVRQQTFPDWQLVLVNDGSPAPHVRPLLDELAKGDDRIRVLHLDTNRGVAAASNAGLAVATGECVLFLDHDDALEPHCLHRFAEAVLSEQRPGLIYADEALTGPDLTEVLAIRARPAFSHDFYLCHPYFVHPVAIRRDLLQQVNGFDESLTTSHDVDLVLRVLAVCAAARERVTHIPDVLYRWRTHPGSHGHASRAAASANTRAAVERYLWEGEAPAEPKKQDGSAGASPSQITRQVAFNVLDIRYTITPGARVAILIPTKNQAALLRECVESVERTIPHDLADIVVIDHASDDAETLAYLVELRQRHRVVTASGPFNFSAINNGGVAQIRGPYSHYLFLNNDTVAPEPGWLEHMLGFACRPDAGVVGATLIHADNTIQHSGIVVGLLGGADNAFRGRPFSRNFFDREPGENCDLICTRDFSAVTAACMLVRADVFDAVGGFDEELAVGFNDVDFCLRVRAKGWKVLRDAHAVLFHHESRSRGTADKHPADTTLFRERYAELLRIGDPHTSPLLDPNPAMNVLIPKLRCPETVRFRTVTLR